MPVDGIDQAWGMADPKAAKAAGIKVVSMYLSNDTSKNVTAAKVKAYHAQGIGVLLNWESDPGRPLLGAQAGKVDASTAVAQAQALIRAVGYAPKNKLSIVFSCDRDITSANYADIDAYYAQTKAIVGKAGFVNGCYGEADLVEHLHAKGLTAMEWQTLAWSGGRISAEADFYQSSINNTLGGASVDDDEIKHINQLGAWWPSASALNNAGLEWSDLATKDEMLDAMLHAVAALRFGVPNAMVSAKNGGALIDGGGLDGMIRGHASTANINVDTTAVANQILAQLGPNLAKSVVKELSSAIARGEA